jgi:hypothetical protein
VSDIRGRIRAEGRMYEINRRFSEIRNSLILLDKLETKETSATREDFENPTWNWTKELKEAYDLRPELEAELEEHENELNRLLR